MGKFAISCPSCGNYVTAYNGLRGLIQNEITCGNCNTVIDVKNNRMTSVVCPNCNNSVMYDQGKRIPKCPVCDQEISPASGQKMIKIHCPTCHAAYSMSEGTTEYTCPLCDSVIDVRKEIAAMHANAGATSLIEYDPGDKDWLIYKHPIKNFSNGSQLIVRPGQQALLVEAGEDSHLFGSGQYTMDTANYPWMDKLYRLSNGDTKGTFQSNIYYFNLRTITNDAKGRPLEWFVKKTPVVFSMKFEGTSRSTNVIFDVGCGGTYDIHIEDARRLYLNLNSVVSGLNAATLADQTYSDAAGTLSRAIKAKISSWGGEILSNLFNQLNIGIFELNSRRSDIAQAIEEKVNKYLREFGLEVSNLLVDSFATPEDDPDDPGYDDFINFRTMSSKAAVSQQKEIHLQDIEEQQRITQRQRIKTAQEALGFDEVEARRKVIEAEAEAQAQRMAGLTEAEIMRAKGYTEKDVLQAEVQKAYAEGLGNMGPVISSGGGSGVMGDMLGLGVGLAAASAVAPQIGGMMQGLGMQQTHNQSSPADSWDCSCGYKGVITNYCPNCGKQKPISPMIDRWNCMVCGSEGNTMEFCPGCGSRRPESYKKDIWDCPICGAKGNTMKFCPRCGARQPEQEKEETWDCPACGSKGNTTKFCPECGAKQPESAQKVAWICPSCGTKDINSAFCPSCGKQRPMTEDISRMEE